MSVVVDGTKRRRSVGPIAGGDRRSLLRRCTERIVGRMFESLETRQLLAAAAPIISEFMADNGETLADQDGAYSDWIEIHNPTAASVNLDGYFLTDDASAPTKWRLPSVTLPAGGNLVVFASGKDRAVAGQELHTNFSLDALGEYLAIVKPDGTVAQDYAPQYPQQLEDVSYGIAIDQSISQLIKTGDTVRTRIPNNGSLGTSWTAWDYNDGSWNLGNSGVGFDVAAPAPVISGFTARMVDIAGGTDGLIDHINDATSILDGTASSGAFNFFWQGTRDYSTVNLGNGGNFGSDQQLPNGYGGTGGDQDAAQRTDYAIRSTATVNIPAGKWTIAVNSDDGFRLRLPGVSFINRYGQNTSGVTVGNDTLVHATPRGPGNTLGTFTVASGGLSNIPLTLDFYERGGGDTVELSIASGHHSGHSASFVLLSDGQNGWSVKTTQSTLPPTYDPLIGAGGDLESAMYNKSHTAYIRQPFTIADSVDFDQLKLRMKYDDGFVAYLNGVEVARRNAPSTLSYNSSAAATHPDAQAFVFEEIDISQHIGALRVGGNVLAIHGLNHASNASDFLILPELDGVYVFPDQQRYFENPTPGQLNDVSSTVGFVEDTEFSVDRGLFDAPFAVTITSDTVGAEIRYTLNGDAPTATTGLVYTGPINISGTTVLRAAAFKPGHIPSNVDTQTYVFVDDVITQAANGQAPAGWPTSWGSNVVDYGMDPDVVNNPAYAGTIRDDLKSIPTISLVTDLEHLFDPTTGIYANPGQDGRAWERPVSIELINPDGSVGFQENAGIRIRGGFSRSTNNPKHAFRLFFRDEYGAGRLDFPLFGPDAAQSFDKFDLRTFQNYSWSFGGDSRGVFVRDQFSRDAQLDMGHNSTRGQFVHLYINGMYWGLFNTEERPEAAYAASYEGGTDEDYDVIKVEAGSYTINATDGDMDAWTQLYNAMIGGFETPEKYWKVQGRNPDGTINPAYENLLDVESLIDYMLVIFYTGNFDAPLSGFLGNTSPNNWYGIRSRTRNEGFKFVVHDSEHTLLLGNTQIGDGLTADRTGPFYTTYSLSKSNPHWLFQELAKNPEFRSRVADHVHKHWFNNGALTPQKNLDRFNARINEIHDAVVGESARWGDAKRSTPLTRNNEWLSYVNRLRNEYFPFRSNIVLNQLKNDSLYPNLVAPSFNQHGGEVGDGFQLSISAPAGTIYYTLDGSDPRAIGGAIAPGARTYSGAITLTQTSLARARVYSGGQWSALNEATFSFRPTQLRITEVMYNPAPGPVGSPYDAQDFEFIEVRNTGSTSMNLLGTRITQGIDFTFGNLVLAGGQRAVVVKNLAAFQSRYGTGVTIAGTYGDLNLSNSGERLALESAQGAVLLDFTYSDGWYPQTDGGGYSLVVVDPLAPNAEWSLRDNWRPSDPLHGGPGAADPGLNGDAVVVNEVMTNTNHSDGDWIELRNTTAAAIDIGGWFLSDTDTDLKKFRIPNGTTIPANGYIVFRESAHFGLAGNPGVNTPFELSRAGEKVYLTKADAAGNLKGYRDDRDFEAADSEVTFGRHIKSTGGIDFVAMNAPTQGSANSAPRVGPVVINEIMYHPVTGNTEFLELRNVTGSAVPLYDPANPTNTWSFADGITFTFPQGASIAAFGYALIVPIDPATFRSVYSVPAAVPIWQYTGALANDGENVTLVRPLAPMPDSTIPHAIVDRVRYINADPWPTEPAGAGPSLAKLAPNTYGNDAAHWGFETPFGSPGKENFDAGAPAVDIVDVVPDPRNASVNTITITFSEPVTGFNLADLSLTRNGGSNLLTGSQTLTTSDNTTFTLGNLAGLTGTAGNYLLTLTASGSGIADLSGNALATGATDAWTSDTTAPIADVVNVAPDPRATSVNTITITFSEPVFNFDLADLTLTRSGGANLLTASQTITSSDNLTWTLGNLSSLTGAAGSYVLTVLAAGIVDGAGNPVAANATDAWTVDNSIPTVDVLDVTPDPRNNFTSAITFVFSEPVAGFDKSDLTLTRNGAAVTIPGTLSTSDNISWTLTGLDTATGVEGNYVITLNATGSGIADLGGNALAASASDAWTVDSTAPTADIIDVAPDPRNTAVNAITIVFSEPVTGFDVSDLILSRNASSNLLTGSQTLSTTDNRTWTLSGLSSVTALAGTYQIGIKSTGTGIVDAAGNLLSGAPIDTFVIDTTVPTANVIDVAPDPRNTAVNTITITFNEPVAGFDITDLVLSRNGGSNLLTSSQTLTTADNLTFTLGNLATLTGSSGAYTLTLLAAGSGITDSAGNAIAADAADAWTTDTSAPTVDIVNISPDPRNTSVSSYTINFSEPVFDFDLADLTLTRDGGANLLTTDQTLTTTNNRTWTLNNVGGLTSTSGVHRLTVIAAGIHDAAGNPVAANASDTVTIDFNAPTLDVVDVAPDPRNSAVSTITLIISEPIGGLDVSDLSLTRDGAAVPLTGVTISSTDTRTYTINGLGAHTGSSGAYTFSVRGTGSDIHDLAGNAFVAGASDSWVTDAAAPSVDIVDVTPDPRRTFTHAITIAFSEPVTGFDLADLSLTRDGGANLIASFHTLTTSDGGRNWVLEGLDNQTGPEGDYVLTLNAAGSGIADLAGNALAAGASDAWTVDFTRPTVDIIDVTPDPRASAVNEVAIAFSEPVAGFDLGDIVLARAGGPNLLTAAQTLTTTDNITFTLGNLAGITGVDGLYDLFVKGAGTGITDSAGNAVNGGAKEAFLMDTSAPTADVIDVTPDPRVSSVDTLTLTFSEPVTGVDLADLSLTRDGGANLLTAAQTIATTDDRTYTISGLGGLTGQSGTYLLTLDPAGSGIIDTAGNALSGSASDTWLVDGAGPTVDVVDVTPDPRNSLVRNITIVFSEAVVGFDWSDLTLTRNGGSNLITSLHTLTTSDGGKTWELGGLDNQTGPAGDYVITLDASGSGIADAAGNLLADGASDAWSTEYTRPTVSISPVFPDPRNSGVEAITITFSEPVVGFDLDDLSLSRNGAGVSLKFGEGRPATLTSSDNRTWTLGNLGITHWTGNWVLTVGGSFSSITDAAGNVLQSSASEAWTADLDWPMVDIADVTPDPRNTNVATIAIQFTESVTGFDVADVVLTRDGMAVPLTGATITGGGADYTLGGLSELTNANGTYVLTVRSTGSSIRDLVGNDLIIDATDSWMMDGSGPTANVTPVAPDPRRTPAGSITFVFSEPVTGFDESDLMLTRNGVAIPIPGTLATTDSVTWTLAGIDNATGPEGDYVITLKATGSGITDASGNTLAADASDAWTVDFTAPTADIIDVTPDPRDGAVDSIQIVFSEPVTGLDLGDLRLARDGFGNFLVGSSATLTTSDNVTWTLAGLTGVTNEPGMYTLTLPPSGSGIEDAAGNDFAADAVEQWTYQQPSDGSISGVVFVDRNSDGTQDSGEPPLVGWTAYLDADDDGQLDAGETSTTTGAAGQYSFTDLAPGDYVVRHVVSSGYVNTSPSGGSYDVQLVASQSATGRNFGNFPTLFGPEVELRARYAVRRAGDMIEIMVGTAQHYTIAADRLPSLTFAPVDTGGDQLTVDFSGGDPLPAGGISYDGGEPSNRLIVIGTAGPDDVDITADAVTVNGRTIDIANVDSVDVDGGAGADSLAIDGNKSTELLGSDLDYASISIADGSRVRRVAGGDIITTGSLTMGPGAAFDIYDNDLLVTGGELNAITQLVASARNGGTTRWLGNGIGSMTAAFNNPGGLKGLAVGMQADDVLVKYTWNGDANLDGKVNADDYFRIDSGFLAQPPNPAYAQGDFNYDGKINADDYFLIDSAFLGQGATLAAGAVSNTTDPTAATASLTTPVFINEPSSMEKKEKARQRDRAPSLFSTTRLARKAARKISRA